VVESHPNYYALKFLTYEGVLEGYPDGTFRPNAEINRAELLKVLVYSWYDGMPDKTLYKDCFNDVASEWFAPYVCYAKELGWVEGYADGGFHPDSTVTKGEALKMIMKYWDVELPAVADVSDLPYDDVYAAIWYAPYVEKAYELGILEETGGSFGGTELRTRAAVCEELFRLFVVGFMGAEQYNQASLDAFLEGWGEFFL
ncbi:MAG: S-layer homology domain-containing protein, partial [Candidatus Gracilibacteria bacterium]